MLCEDCTKVLCLNLASHRDFTLSQGFTLDGNPEGKIIEGGAYFHAAPSGTPSKAAVVLLTDIFGLGIPNPKILADQYSQALDIVSFRVPPLSRAHSNTLILTGCLRARLLQR